MAADRLGVVWPQVQPKLLRLLEKRGLTRSQAEDVCQDVAVRALASGVEFHNADDLYRWAGQVARNLHVDLLRSVSRIACDDSVLVDMQGETDVEHEVERRIALAKVLKHWLTLRPMDRAALLEGMYADGSEDRGEAVKFAVRRHRARQRLRLLTDGAFGIAAVTACLRRLKAFAGTAPAATLVAAPVAFLVAAGPILGPAGTGSDGGTVSTPVRQPARMVLVENRTDATAPDTPADSAVRPARPARQGAVAPAAESDSPPPAGKNLPRPPQVERTENEENKTEACAGVRQIAVKVCVTATDPSQR